ncbi:AraC family transcriptional regulator [Crenobacter luteus]|uniref:AraC family transcriptional regulator n=1 Tax=Crenobacter luteus TaxID=1452487 RepID=A0A165EK42_9NEIS|nr:AraC family transcriptional regulator [Crenobacter luteus]KZE24959.1 AraC family transcriptional regulator [Crenobacter luteus]TCP15120.1 AraC family transcriptional regulator [Crenobacter luteus]
MNDTEYARFFRADDVAPLECLDARYVEHAFAPHLHDEYVVAVLTGGVETYRYRGQLCRAGPGTIAVINPQEVHTGEAGAADGWAYRVFYPSLDFVARVAGEVGGRPGPLPVFDASVLADAALAARLAALHRLLERETDALVRESALLDGFAALMLRHMRVVAAPAPDHPAALARAKERLAEALDEKLTLSELAAEVALSPFHLSRLFRRAYGLPPAAWRTQLRIARARGLLAQGVAPAEVAQRLGFADQSHLTRAFGRALGVTPAAYQKALRG